MALSDFLKRISGKQSEPGIHLDIKPQGQPAAGGKDSAAGAGPGGRERRKSLRVAIRGLQARLTALDRSLPVHDVSVSGAGLVFKGKRVKAGSTFKLDLVENDTVYAEGLRAKVIRHDEGMLGVVWIEPDRHQDEGLHKIVLEAQKRQAAKRKGTAKGSAKGSAGKDSGPPDLD